MALNKFRAGQIKDTDLITEAEFHTFAPANNIFLTQVGTTQVKVTATADKPASLTINDELFFNTSDTSNLTISGASGTYDVFAIGDTPNVKTFTLDFAEAGNDPSATNFRRIGTVEWDGAAITSYISLSDAFSIETQTPTNGQTVFTLNDITYLPGTYTLEVYINGLLQIKDLNYTETDSTTVTISSSALTTDDRVSFIVWKDTLLGAGFGGGVSGTLDISQGGTGETTVVGVKSAFDIFSAHQPLESGRYYTHFNVNTGAANTSTASITPTNITYAPILIPSSCTVTEVGIEITASPQAGKFAVLGIYSPDSTGRPGSRLATFGTVSIGSVALATITISQSLSAGLYFLAGQVESTTTLRTMGTLQRGMWWGNTGTDASGAGISIVGFNQGRTYDGTLPATATPVAQTAGGYNAMMIWVRI